MAVNRPIVLICFDDEPVGHALRFVLQLEDVDVRICPDAAALLDSPVLSLADCLVLRDGPPWQDGCALARAAREKGAVAPVILLVGAQTAQVKARAEAAEIWRVLESPVMDDRLVNSIMSCLPGRGPLRINT